MAKNRKVLLVAMSGVRIYDPELRKLGMTLPGFIERGKVIASLPSLGLLTLAGLTPPHWDVEYAEVDALDEESIERICAKTRDLVAISSLTARIDDAYALADELRKRGRKVCIGGLHASVLPEEVAKHADAVVIGEGEAVWQSLLEDVSFGRIKSFYRSTPSRSFETDCVPAYHLLDPDRYNRITLQTARGCPLDCSFCAASRLISPYKRKSIAQIEAELDAIEAIWPRPFIELADDNTFVNKKWGKEVVRAIARRKLKWFTETDISIADDDELLGELAQSGCAQVLIGFESVDVDSLADADSKKWKQRRRGRYLEGIAKIQSYGISVNGCFVLGFDGDEPTIFERTLDFVREARLSEVQITALTPFPGTALYERLRREGRLLQERFWSKCTLFDVTFRPAKMSPEELRSGLKNLAAVLYSHSETEHRKRIFRECVRNKVRA